MKKIVVIGASPNPERVSYSAVKELQRKGHEVIAVGIKPGQIGTVAIHTDRPRASDVDTVTLYVGPDNQSGWKEYICSLKPRRAIFNPGTENEVFIAELTACGIACEKACTLVLLSTGTF